MVQGVNRVGNTLKFDNFIGAHYNVFTPSSGSVVYIDPEDTVKSGFITFHNNGQVEPQFLILNQPESVAAEKIVVLGEWVSGSENLYIGYNNGNKYILRAMQLGLLEAGPSNPPGVLFFDNFESGLSKWSITNSAVTFDTAGNSMNMSSSTPASGESASANVALSDTVFDASGDVVAVFTLKSTNQDSYGGFSFGLSNGVDSYLVLHSGLSGQGNNIRITGAEPGAVLYDALSRSINITDYRKFKIKVGPSGTRVSVWNSNAEFWDTLVEDDHAWSADDLKVRASQGSDQSDTNPIMVTSIGEITVYDQDFNGETP